MKLLLITCLVFFVSCSKSEVTECECVAGKKTETINLASKSNVAGKLQSENVAGKLQSENVTGKQMAGQSTVNISGKKTSEKK